MSDAVNQPTRHRGGRRPRLINFQGQSRTLNQWAASLGITRDGFNYRLANWPIEQVFTLYKNENTPSPKA